MTRSPVETGVRSYANTVADKLPRWPAANRIQVSRYGAARHDAQNSKARIAKGVTTLIVLIVVGFRLTSRWAYDAGGGPDHR